MPRSGDISARVAVVAADATVRDAAVAALEGDSSLAVTTPSGQGPDAARQGVEDGAACIVCGPDETVYDAVRETDRARPVVVLDPGGERVPADLLDRVLDDPVAAYVADGDHTERLVRSRVRDFVEHERDEVGWHLADLSDEAIVSFELESYAVREANDAFFEHWALDPADLEDATLADLRETDITHQLRGQGRGEPGEEELEWIRDGGPVETFVEGAMTGDFERREWHCAGVDGAFKSEVEIVADRSAGIGYLVATVPDDDPDADYDEAAMLRSVMEHVPMSVYFEDTRGRHVQVSEDLVEPFIEGTDGKIMHTPDDVHGKTYFDLYPLDVAEEATADNQRIMESGEPLRDKEKHVQPPHGRDLWFSTNKAPWYDESGRLRGIVGITVDVTDQKRRERELDRQNERLDEFASIVSHDLRNPLNVAQGRLDLYRQSGDESELDVIAEMHDRIESIVDDVLTYARKGSRVEQTEWLDGATVAARAWGSVATATATLEQDWEYAIEADAERLARLFENLFRNAVEHGSTSSRPEADDAGEDVTVRVGTLDDDPGFYVEDDGPGIELSNPGTAFQRGVTTEDGGTGFGLAVVREIAEAHGWTARVADGARSASDGDTPDPDTEPAKRDRGARFEFRGVPRGDDL
ncbi:PAS domain-containing sensor histidine kinase [Halosimplex salinum]|uniref:PAS domain-containing sensor histidine kinase n=1 Tax=Halosimplex salinum TaxID=1710538 RepID=UPI000F46BA56|nr:PAS domain-containing sensor histidine kinase [Halosimplex salinum]